MKPRLFFIQGAPAIGKSTIMERLRSDYPKGVFIEMDAIQKLRGEVDWDSHGEAYRLALETVASLIDFHTVKQEADPLFVIDCLSEKGLKSLVGTLKRPVDYKQIIVWAENAELKKRMEHRKGHAFHNLEIAFKMNNWLRDYSKTEDRKKCFFVDTTGMALEKSVKQVRSIIDKAYG